jgi:acetylornithine/succinyldiaminopimelate/putrescine aminotransferase
LIKEARGLGLILGIALTKEIGNEVQLKCEENGLLVNSIHNKVIRLAPPLIVTKKDINKAIKIIIDILNNY